MSVTRESGPEPSVLIVMGVSGSGKTTIGALLARLLHWEFVDGDSLHPAANVRKMQSGVALTDEDRWPWLHAIAAWIDATRATGRHGVVACSALKRSYRRLLLGTRGDVRIVYLQADFEIVRQRMSTRTGHFMPVALLRSQFDTLEEPGPGEHAVVVPANGAPDTLAAEALTRLGLKPPT
jgi:carbohydrate kinase (thermoresistant glucokinase family)